MIILVNYICKTRVYLRSPFNRELPEIRDPPHGSTSLDSRLKCERLNLMAASFLRHGFGGSFHP